LKGADDQESSFSLPSPLSQNGFGLPSPISDYSSTAEDNLMGLNQRITSWDLPTDFSNDTFITTSLYNSPSEDSSPLAMIPDSTASPESSSSNSPQNVDQDMKTKKPTKRERKPQSENGRAKSPALKRQNAHNLIEKRYRNNLNSKINSLRDCLPSLRTVKKEKDEEEDGMESDSESKTVRKCNKGVILGHAISYIAQLEKQVEKLSKENKRLQFMVDGSLENYIYTNGQQCKAVRSKTVGRTYA